MTSTKKKNEIGNGIYTPTDIAKILRVSNRKANAWINKYWDGRFAKLYQSKYSWKVENTKAVDFFTLIEFYILIKLVENGIRHQTIYKAHEELSQIVNNRYPFTLKKVLKNIRTDKRSIIIKLDDKLINLDGSKQLSLEFLKTFYSKIEFGKDDIASKLYPLGKEKAILIDPDRKFGHPVLEEKNIYPETLYKHYKSGDPIPYLSKVYGISEQNVLDSIAYCEAA